MNDYSWEQENKNNQINNSKIKKSKQEDYEDDAFQEQTSKKQIKSIQLPRIQQKSKNLANSKQNNTKLHQSDKNQDYTYQEDFEQGQIKKQPQNHFKKVNKDKKSKQKTLQKKNIEKSSIQKSKGVRKTSQNQNRKSLEIATKNTSTVQSKYLYYLKTQFPHTRQQIKQFQPQKINRLSQKLKGYIKMVNDQLTDLINQNMRKLKAGSLVTKVQTKSVDQQIKILTEHKKNRQVYLETLEKQQHKLNGRFDNINEQQVQLNMDSQLQKTKQLIKDLSKEITFLKLDMHHEGNKLAIQKNYAQMVNQAKNKLIFIKKQEEKNNQKSEKTDKKLEELNEKTPEIEIQLQKLMEQAKKQNIVLVFQTLDKKKQDKVEQLKKKFTNLKLHKQKMQGLSDTKLNILKRDIELLTNQIAEHQKKSILTDAQIKSTLQMSVILIQQSKQINLQPHIEAHLDFIYKNIKEGNPLNKSNLKFIKNSKQKLQGQNSKRDLKKYSSVTSVHAYNRSQSQSQLKPSFHITKKSPLNLKGKQKNVLKLSQKAEQRIWKQNLDKEFEQQKQKIISETNSKPFSIKKTQNDSQPVLKTQQKSKGPIDGSDQKQNQKQSIFVNKMKFKRKESKQHIGIEIQKQIGGITQKNVNQIKVKTVTQDSTSSKPQFRIKKAVKQIVQIPDEDLYLFPTQSKQNISKDPSNKETGQKPAVKQININSKGPNFKLTKGITESIQKPKLNLSVKQPKQNKQSGIQYKNQPSITQQISTKNVNISKQIQPSISKKQIKTNNQIQENINTDQESNINIAGGRRQVQRKIQRKNQEAYVI